MLPLNLHSLSHSADSKDLQFIKARWYNTITFLEVATEDDFNVAAIIFRTVCGLSEAYQLVTLQPGKGWNFFLTNLLPQNRNLFVFPGQLLTYLGNGDPYQMTEVFTQSQLDLLGKEKI